ncbi:protein SOB FIVE-LIKE 5-like isoform X2 [Solanum dulcamara]|uniref:protein SOB FIVE-LIKE 5-like isoform X2 n=1 Tax=Solanum dulcamara TaxID=45834 RepID=UPI0024858DBE|nr:protein SOB FIVE-LIKE 5-like isoform X2 [Solanum dulcamara]
MDYGMVAADSECSSGCESGWTLYLENSFLPCCKDNNLEGEKSLKQKEEETEEEDLSMVSDASSGPPNFHQEEEYGHNIINGSHYYAPITNPKRQKAKDKKQKQISVLDDTASSPIFDFSNNNFSSINNNTKSVENVLDFSQGYSTTHFQGRSTYQEHYGYFQSSLLSGNKLQENQWFEEKRWG